MIYYIIYRYNVYKKKRGDKNMCGIEKEMKKQLGKLDEDDREVLEITKEFENSSKKSLLFL